MLIKPLKRHENSVVVEVSIPDGKFCCDCFMGANGSSCILYEVKREKGVIVDTSIRVAWVKCTACLGEEQP